MKKQDNERERVEMNTYDDQMEDSKILALLRQEIGERSSLTTTHGGVPSEN